MNEEQIINEIKKGNIDLFQKIVDKYKNKIFSMAYKFTNDYNEAQDLSQEIFLKIYNRIDSFRYDSKFSTWIYSISMNTCLDWKRKRKKMKVIIFSSMDKENKFTLEENIRDEEVLPDEKVIGREMDREVHKIIYELPNIYKTVIIMYHFNNMSYSEISSHLNIPAKTVETRLYRGRRILRDKLSKAEGGGVSIWSAKK
ncbi:RNA polymerase sigma factor [Caldisalinibacter kiritimatiensis]|uniref:RNA polymerase sigma-70 factor, ECF subfamily n=1 Tax=Caldisalinibacter kiritimatiensis TaxID=1304284 RepID=R1AWD8_9FIRM|nr:sigma-70 family RNA polymerase sigma factor [Caldisalinibacter kiritimatiensis]EOD00937.1 RNA polymerase sigma-70 factor, ECF subfamily [Caldisalinibacter kiritimatiensis]